MSYSLSIDHAAFAELGKRVTFDGTKFRDLLDMAESSCHPDAPTNIRRPDVAIFPHRAWQLREKRFGLVRAAGYLINPLNTKKFSAGEYHSKMGRIAVALLPGDADHANNTLLHEVRHWADDSDHTVKGPRHTLKRIGAGASLAAGVATGIGLVAADIVPASLGGCEIASAAGATVTLGSLIISNRLTYSEDPYEIRARDFAENPDITQRFGNIITCEPLNR